LFGRPGRCGALSGHGRYDVVIYLLFLGGRGKEKLWVQILHHLSNLGVDFYTTGCGRKPQNQCSIRLLAPIDSGKSFISLLISNAPVSPCNEVCKRYANLIGAEPQNIRRGIALRRRHFAYTSFVYMFRLRASRKDFYGIPTRSFPNTGEVGIGAHIFAS
jgi:hypothetical protein